MMANKINERKTIALSEKLILWFFTQRTLEVKGNKSAYEEDKSAWAATKKPLGWCLQTHRKQIYSAMHTKLWKCLWIIRSWVSLFWSSCFEQYEVYFSKKYWFCSKPFIFVGIQAPNTEIEENSKQIIVLLFTTMKLLPLSFV